MPTFDQVAIAGATGAVGREMLDCLAGSSIQAGRIRLFASARSAGKTVTHSGKDYTVEELTESSFDGINVALFSAGGSISKALAPVAVQAGCIVVDNSSAFRMDANVPLVIPEVNPADAAQHQGIIANPNCTTIIMAVPVWPLHQAKKVLRIQSSTYQAVSGTGNDAIEALHQQTLDSLNNKRVEPTVYPRQIAFNALPHAGPFQENGYTQEEMKLVWETRKIFEDESILVNPTCVRIPVFFGHSEALHIETDKKISVADARKKLEEMQGVTVIDAHEDGGYPTAVTDASGTDQVFVGRIREDISHPNGLNLWVVSDNVRKGAALNSVQIGEILVKHYL